MTTTITIGTWVFELDANSVCTRALHNGIEMTDIKVARIEFRPGKVGTIACEYTAAEMPPPRVVRMPPLEDDFDMTRREMADALESRANQSPATTDPNADPSSPGATK